MYKFLFSVGEGLCALPKNIKMGRRGNLPLQNIRYIIDKLKNNVQY